MQTSAELLLDPYGEWFPNRGSVGESEKDSMVRQETTEQAEEVL